MGLLAPSSFIPGEVRMFGGVFIPNGWLECDGTELGVPYYGPLFNSLVKVKQVEVPAFGSTSVHLVNHRFPENTPLVFSNLDPGITGITAGVTVYVVPIDEDSFAVANAPGGTPIVINGGETDFPTVTVAPWGYSAASNTFNLPDFRTKVPAGADKGRLEYASLSTILSIVGPVITFTVGSQPLRNGDTVRIGGVLYTVATATDNDDADSFTVVGTTPSGSYVGATVYKQGTAGGANNFSGESVGAPGQTLGSVSHDPNDILAPHDHGLSVVDLGSPGSDTGLIGGATFVDNAQTGTTGGSSEGVSVVQPTTLVRFIIKT